MKEIDETGKIQYYKPDRWYLAWWMAKRIIRLPLRWVMRSFRRVS